MRLVVWNCNMAAHRKRDAIRSLRPDVLVLAECSGPVVRDTRELFADATCVEWTGVVRSKGLAVLSYGDWTLRAFPAERSGNLSIPVWVDGPASFGLLAMWTQGPGYIREVHKALDAYGEMFDAGPTLVAGDLNSNRVWDALHAPRWSDHMPVVVDVDLETGTP